MECLILSLYSLAWRPLFSYYNVPLLLPHTPLTIALLGGLYVAIIIDCYVGPHTSVTITSLGGLYLTNIMDRYVGPQTALIISLLGGLY
jgi:hypothetical protein